MPEKVIYEQPLNERTRTFLRLEFLFSQTRHYLRGDSHWNSRAALVSLLDILNIISGKTDLKTEILKELERHTTYLAELEENPNVDRERLEEILDDLDSLIDKLHEISGQIGQSLKSHEFLSTIRQRSTIPGGTCDFDIPAYHFWLEQPAKKRLGDLKAWMNELVIIEHSLDLIMHLVRHSSLPKKMLAENGLFQVTLDSQNPCQLVRVSLPADAVHFPEISGGKHRITIRFMMLPEFANRPIQVTENINFELTCCAI